MWTANSFTSDQYAQVTLTSTQLTATQWIGPSVRAQNSGLNGYVAIYFWNNGSPLIELFLRNGGGWTQLGSAYSVSPLAAGAVLGLQAAGSSLSVMLNGTTVITAADATYTGGAPGLMTNGAGPAAGLSGSAVLQDNGGDNLTVTANGTFTFATKLAAGAAYNVTVATSPAGQTCTVANGTGTIGSANVTGVTVTCTNTSAPTYSVGGTASGLSGSAVLQDNGGDNLTVTANGTFTFATKLAAGAAYNVTVATSPAGQTCTVANGTGTIGSANVTGVTVTCTNTSAPTYSVGGTASGLSGSAVLQDNGGDNLTVTANGTFTF